MTMAEHKHIENSHVPFFPNPSPKGEKSSRLVLFFFSVARTDEELHPFFWAPFAKHCIVIRQNELWCQEVPNCLTIVTTG
jgi:hypothetical protein